MRALAERFRELGFRVIDGEGKNELVLKTPGLAWAVAKEHKHVLRDIREHRQKIGGPDLGNRFDEHCRPIKYKARDGHIYDGFELTQTGVLIVAAKYDAALQLLLALLFDAVSKRNEAQADSFVRQITARLREIRGKARQADLFDTPTSVPEVRKPGWSKEEDENEPYEYRYAPTGNQTWDEIHNGTRYLAIVTPQGMSGLPLQILIRFAHIHRGFEPHCSLIPHGNSQANLIWDWGKTPRAVIDRVLDRLGMNTADVRRMLDRFFD